MDTTTTTTTTTTKEQEPLQPPRGTSSSLRAAACAEKKGVDHRGDDLRALVTRRAERVVATRVAQLLADGVI